MLAFSLTMRCSRVYNHQKKGSSNHRRHKRFDRHMFLCFIIIYFTFLKLLASPRGLGTLECIGSTEDSSSVVTFRSCVNAIRLTEPDFFVLENVDLSDTDDVDGNLQMIVRFLQDAQYRVRTFRLFGLPQRRLRIYMCGFHSVRQQQASFQKVERYLSAMRLPKQSPATCF